MHMHVFLIILFSEVNYIKNPMLLSVHVRTTKMLKHNDIMFDIIAYMYMHNK